MHTKTLPIAFLVLALFALGANAVDNCPGINNKIDREIAELQEASEQYDMLTMEYEESLTQALDDKPEGFIEEMKNYTGIKAKFARGRLEKKIQSKRSSVANLKKSFCVDCAGSARTESGKTAYCTKCPDGPGCTVVR